MGQKLPYKTCLSPKVATFFALFSKLSLFYSFRVQAAPPRIREFTVRASLQELASA